MNGCEKKREEKRKGKGKGEEKNSGCFKRPGYIYWIVFLARADPIWLPANDRMYVITSNDPNFEFNLIIVIVRDEKIRVKKKKERKRKRRRKRQKVISFDEKSRKDRKEEWSSGRE